MYIDPFVAGILATLGMEVLALVIAAGVSAARKGKRR